MATTSKEPRPLCDICLQTPWYELPAEDHPQHLHQKSLAALEKSAETCPMCKLVLEAATSHDEHLRSTRNGKGFWTLRHFRDCVTRIGETPKKMMFLTLFGADAPAESPNFSGMKFEKTTNILMATPGTGSAKSVLAIGFLRAIKMETNGLLAPTSVTDDLNCHIDGAEPYDDHVVQPELPRKDMKVFVYGNWWASGDSSQGQDSALPDTLVGIGARIGTEAHILQETFNSKDDQMIWCGSGIGICTDNGNFTQSLSSFNLQSLMQTRAVLSIYSGPSAGA